MKYLLAALFVVACVFIVQSARLKNCKGWPSFKRKSVSDCEETHEFCPFKRGKNVSFDSSFVAPVDTSDLTFQVWGKVAGTPVKVPFPIDPNDVCEWGVKCPVKKGQKYDFKVAVFVEKVFPRTRVTVGIEVLANNKTKVACTTIPVQIT
ncbi:protein NPC2-like protein [Leptotrombidium deliense]|uniref:Protein NPC2-like protein n=1 Tax=Leptotrombidium deliense TaxID=299467 RepID=A0A443S5F8_9ACAR|nr:protein NPC2-like protein [Leptotrombidium deliense]